MIRYLNFKLFDAGLLGISYCNYFWLLIQEFYHKSVVKPHIFGMTASPVIRKGWSVCTREGILSAISYF